MKILIVANFNRGFFSPFIVEQVEALRSLGCEVAYFGIVGKGIKGYWGNRGRLLDMIRSFRPDLIHAHYGLSGLLANSQRRVPVVTTYHGSDINDPGVRCFSLLAIGLSRVNIFVSGKMLRKVWLGRAIEVVPCGVDLETLALMTKGAARKKLGMVSDLRVVLFAGAFGNPVKNYPLAREAVDLLDNVSLLELKGYSREQVCLLMNACDALLMTSFSEGSPQVIKEAMACGCPIVSVNVGEVEAIIGSTPGCFLCAYSPGDVAEKIRRALEFGDRAGRTHGRERISGLGLDGRDIARRLLAIYEKACS